MARPETQKHIEAFEAWYAGQRNFRETSKIVEIKECTLYVWAERYQWHERADDRDAKVRAKDESAAVAKQLKRLEEQRQAGTLLRHHATKHFYNDGAEYVFEGTGAALSALKMGIDIERQSDGLPSAYLAIANANSIEELDALKAAIQAGSGANDGGD